ncbi:[LSU ribosomal protein L11P]-lysine N-methyltransferase [Mariprofundus ferrinatatus]|uniref:Ribosomal protein L11 methyltransferase n=1 Tax=Mariprofundus ferrinatatus TaxID=1921087 RepID=A0A2K8L648_9PROT|nr:50S ribosomal protein L11 methyltransferase [Mariprofundus ferrinatatus]ATX82800.1 [LSU ribosomal protein L11P]-lysine N-methyltransferase [Mariprofundus ferrinatatus]
MQASKCLELKITASALSEEAFELLAAALNALGTAEETDADSGMTDRIAWIAIEDDEAPLRSKILEACQRQGIADEAVTLSTLEQQNWETAWQKEWQAMEIGENLCVRPSFCAAPNDGRVDIVLDPGMAFGTGTHPTTQLCLEAVERICKERPPATLLDMGAGSGILAIAALKLGAGSALTVDMEEESVEACLTNAEINGVSLTSLLDDTPPEAKFDLVVANILAGPLVWMARELAPCVGQRLVLSGLLTTQVDDVAEAYIREGLLEVRRDARGEWASVEFIPA